MSGRQLVIIHGWSDNSRSFLSLARRLEQALGQSPKLINLADYISMDDEVTFNDLVSAMCRAWKNKKLPITPRSVDVVVHSTGSLIVRQWLSTYYTPKNTPIYHLVMLAPANFGSPLARKGKAFFGRIIKGFKSKKLFNVGAKLLNGLEMGSAYTWWLAEQDRFGKANYYGPGGVLCTVIVGNTGYEGIAAAANTPGSDGTVMVSSANMNCGYLNADFSRNPLKPTFNYVASKGTTAFRVMDGESHSSITGKYNAFRNPNTFSNIIKGLQISDKQFNDWCAELNERTLLVMQANRNNLYKHGFQNTVTFVKDQFNMHVQDYFIEFYGDNSYNDIFVQKFYENVISSVRTYDLDSSYRSIMIDCTELSKHTDKTLKTINMSLTALPEFKQKGNIVGYRTLSDEDIGAIKISKKYIKNFFVSNRTLLIEITIRREQADSVFKFRKLT